VQPACYKKADLMEKVGAVVVVGAGGLTDLPAGLIF
jgi:hypothetical protein